jgi:hypothetical protein
VLIGEVAGVLAVLILPDVGVLSEAQVAALRKFVAGGGALIASGRSGMFDVWGTRRSDSALADLLGVHATGQRFEPTEPGTRSWERHGSHTYLRLVPELNQHPASQAAPAVAAPRHAALRGFDETDLLPFGGALEHVRVGSGASVLATFVPPFPIYPPEFCWMRTPRTDTPALVARELPGGGRTAYLAADIDRCYGRYQIPDQGELLANLVRWAAGDRLPLRVEGPGQLDCHLYRQGGRRIVHLVNLSSARAWPGFVEETLPVGPVRVAVHVEAGWKPSRARLLVSGREVACETKDGWVEAVVECVGAHEVVVME